MNLKDCQYVSVSNPNRFVLPVTIDQEELNASVDFWVTMLPIVTEQIQDIQQNASLRGICCDALGNLGVHVFEKLPVSRLNGARSELLFC